MVLDSLDRLPAYAALHPRFGKVMEYLSSHNLASLPEGDHQIDGDDIYITIAENILKLPTDVLLEAHDNYIDIQIIISGTESFGWKYRPECVIPRAKLRQHTDVSFFQDQPSTHFTLQQSQFAIFFPSDAHAPLIHAPLAPHSSARKAVVKVRL